MVGSVVPKSRRWREERANARDEREATVYGNSLRSANNPLCNRLRNRYGNDSYNTGYKIDSYNRAEIEAAIT